MKATKAITDGDLKDPVRLRSILGHGDISSLVALEACLTVALLLHRFPQLTRTASLVPASTTLITSMITSTMARRTVREATAIM